MPDRNLDVVLAHAFDTNQLRFQDGTLRVSAHASKFVLDALIAATDLGRVEVGAAIDPMVFSERVRSRLATNAIKAKYEQLGGKRSALGLPLNPSLGVQPSGTTYFMDYRGGRIEASGNTIKAVQTQRVEVWWVGIECRMRQEKPDQIYGSVGAIIPGSGEPFTHKFPGDREYWKMGLAGQRLVNVAVPVYSGPAMDVVIVGSLAEHDSGNIDEYKRKFAEYITHAAQGLAMMEGIPAEATAADQGFLNDLSLGIVNAVSSLLGADDDPYVPEQMILHWTELLSGPFPKKIVRRNDDPHTIEYTHQLVLSGIDQGGDRGEYALYFDVRTFVLTPTTL